MLPRCWFSRELQPSKQRKEHPDRRAVGREQRSKRKPDKHVVSGHSPVLPDELVWPRVQLLIGAVGLPEHPRQVLLLSANNLVLGATHPAQTLQTCEIRLPGLGPASSGAALFLTAVALLC